MATFLRSVPDNHAAVAVPADDPLAKAIVASATDITANGRDVACFVGDQMYALRHWSFSTRNNDDWVTTCWYPAEPPPTPPLWRRAAAALRRQLAITPAP